MQIRYRIYVKTVDMESGERFLEVQVIPKAISLRAIILIACGGCFGEIENSIAQNDITPVNQTFGFLQKVCAEFFDNGHLFIILTNN